MTDIEQIKQWISEPHVNISALSRKSGLSRQYLYQILKGDIKSISTDTYRCLCSALGKSSQLETLYNKKIKIPVVGEIRAGLPTFADENIIDYEEVPEEMVKDGEYFGLKVKGDSMFPRIVEGDVVIVRKQNTANNGDICVVLVNGDSATLKKVKFADNGIMLMPNNQIYETMFYTKKEIQDLPVEIVGKVIELRGKF